MNARRLALVLTSAVALGACQGAKHDAAPPPVAIRDAAAIHLLTDDAQALVTVVFDGWDATHATMQRWVRDAGAWTAAGAAWPTTLGSAGAAWGIGAHGTGAPAGRDGPIKVEGDRRTPAGVFTLAGRYNATGPYQVLTGAWKCVDDPASALYNQIVDATRVRHDWSSAEEMQRDDGHYQLVVDVRHNPAAIPGAGSCIFLHVWGGPDAPTVGCIAMDAARLASLMAAIPPTTSPLLVVLPRTAYETLAIAWGLPSAAAR